MGTANTMCATAEVLGFSPDGNASVRSQTEKWHEMARQAGKQIVALVKAYSGEYMNDENVYFDSLGRYV